MFNIAGFHIPKHIAFKSGAAILEKLGWDHEGLKPLGAVNRNRLTITTILPGHSVRLSSVRGL